MYPIVLIILTVVNKKEYQSHNLTRLPLRGDQSIKDTIFRFQDMENITALASKSPQVDYRLELHNEVH
jgi:hypothetical protein